MENENNNTNQNNINHSPNLTLEEMFHSIVDGISARNLLGIMYAIEIGKTIELTAKIMTQQNDTIPNHDNNCHTLDTTVITVNAINKLADNKEDLTITNTVGDTIDELDYYA